MKLLNVLKVSKTKTKICKICLKAMQNTDLFSIFSGKYRICDDCLNKFNTVFGKFKISSYDALYIYNYDENIQNLLYLFKGCFDYELKEAFISRFSFYLTIKYLGFIKVYAPSFKEDDINRGFNHVEEMFSCLKLKSLKCFIKTCPTKQVDLNKGGRENILSFLKIIDGEKLKNKKVLILDDVYTTGSTMKALIKLVEQYHPKEIKILLMAKTLKKLNESNF